MVTASAILEVQHSNSDYLFSGFEIEKDSAVNVIETCNKNDYSKALWFSENHHVWRMMQAKGYFPGLGLVKHLQGVIEPPPVPPPHTKHGLGYILTIHDESDEEECDFTQIKWEGTAYKSHNNPKSKDCNFELYRKALNGYFVREGEDIPYFIFLEPWTDDKGKRHPGFEIFNDCDSFLDETETVPLNLKDLWGTKAEMTSEWDFVLGEDILR